MPKRFSFDFAFSELINTFPLNMNIGKHRHIIWDWNGTILDDLWLCIEIINHLLKKRNLKLLTKNKYFDIFDFPVIEYYKRAGFDFKKESFEKIANEFIINYNARRHECLLQTGAVKSIITADMAGIGQSLLSASHQSILEEMIEYHNLGKYFTYIEGTNNHYASGKINIGEDLVKRIGISPSEILLIGDTTHDYQASKQLKCDCLLVSNGHHSAGKLQNNKVMVISSLNKLAWD